MPFMPLNDWSFMIGYQMRGKGTNEVIMHEICHFLYFEKWKEVFPKSDPRTFDYPYMEWHLSEILAPVILNDSRVQKILKRKPGFYDEHKNMTIKGKKVPEYFTGLYRERVREGTSFADFLKVAYGDVKEIKERLEGINK